MSDILDTFPIVKGKDNDKCGTYRTKDTILEIYHALAAATQSDQPYQTAFDLPPARSAGIRRDRPNSRMP